MTMQAPLSPPQQPSPLSTLSNLLSPATAPATIFSFKARITHIIHGPAKDESATSPRAHIYIIVVAYSTGGSQSLDDTTRGRPLSPIGLRSGRRGEDSGCEGRLGALQEGIREGHVYHDDEGGSGGDLLESPTMPMLESRHQLRKLRMTRGKGNEQVHRGCRYRRDGRGAKRRD